MYYHESELCVNKYPQLLDEIKKIDNFIYQLPTSSVIDLNDVSLKLKEKKSHLSSIFECLSVNGLLIKLDLLKCPNCGNLIEYNDFLDLIKKDDTVECSQCTKILSYNKSITTTRYQINIEKKLLKESNGSKEFIIYENINDEDFKNIENNDFYILHLSDIHIQNQTQASSYLTHLILDLTNELKIKKLDYIIVSGDIGDTSTETDYTAAVYFFKKLAESFQLEIKNIVIVPGNHDLNWDLSKKSYYYDQEKPSSKGSNKYFEFESGFMIQNDSIYPQRFGNFNKFLYNPLFKEDYPIDYESQIKVVKDEVSHVLIIGFNSSWEIDHHFVKEASINSDALNKVLREYGNDDQYNNWLKIAVWHHPVTGLEMMDDHFLELLGIAGFQLCLHGHIHEAIGNFFYYDEKRKIFIIGAGTFGAPSSSQVQGIPYQYNLLL